MAAETSITVVDVPGALRVSAWKFVGGVALAEGGQTGSDAPMDVKPLTARFRVGR